MENRENSTTEGNEEKQGQVGQEGAPCGSSKVCVTDRQTDIQTERQTDTQTDQRPVLEVRWHT